MPDTHIPATVAAPQSGGGIPAEISAAVGKVMSGIKSLPKSEHNGHANYNFASIDAFLAAVGPLCSAAGLIVIQDEDSAELLDRGGKGWLRIVYSFTLAHVSGAVWDRPMRRTVLQQVTGPQTTGSSQSYALKQFMRSLFQIPTGERDDPDYQAPADMPAAAPQAAGKPAQRAQAPARPSPPSKAQATQESPGDSDGPDLMQIPLGQDGSLLIGKWVSAAKSVLNGRPEAWRREWLAMHSFELDEVRKARRDWADKLEALAIAPDLAPLPDAAE